MRRISRRDLVIELSGALKTALRTNRASFCTRVDRTGTREAAEQQVVDKILSVVDNASTCVIRASWVNPAGDYQKLGKFGRDEPWPAPLLTDGAEQV